MPPIMSYPALIDPAFFAEREWRQVDADRFAAPAGDDLLLLVDYEQCFPSDFCTPAQEVYLWTGAGAWGWGSNGTFGRRRSAFRSGVDPAGALAQAARSRGLVRLFAAAPVPDPAPPPYGIEIVTEGGRYRRLVDGALVLRRAGEDRPLDRSALEAPVRFVTGARLLDGDGGDAGAIIIRRDPLRFDRLADALAWAEAYRALERPWAAPAGRIAR